LKWRKKTVPAGRWWNVKFLKIALTSANPEKPAGKLPFYIITGRRFLRNVGIARYFKTT